MDADALYESLQVSPRDLVIFCFFLLPVPFAVSVAVVELTFLSGALASLETLLLSFAAKHAVSRPSLAIEALSTLFPIVRIGRGSGLWGRSCERVAP